MYPVPALVALVTAATVIILWSRVPATGETIPMSVAARVAPLRAMARPYLTPIQDDFRNENSK